MNQQGVSNSLNDIVDLMLGFLRVSLYTLSVLLLPAGCVQQNTMGLMPFQKIYPLQVSIITLDLGINIALPYFLI